MELSRCQFAGQDVDVGIYLQMELSSRPRRGSSLRRMELSQVRAMCGFFAWKEDIKIPEREHPTPWVEEVKKQMYDLREDVIHGHGEVGHLKVLVQSGIEEIKIVKCILIAIIVAMCLFLSLVQGRN
ncbi:unnamed protein product [Cuscuta europaea]|uniref:Uncharacterized protein n=1 Tax=Cuscuta europaea TaxID=41803 RepID=A0A9P1EEY7_CUSEU|nr:unnamed protein product [Cuscuta europaea]